MPTRKKKTWAEKLADDKDLPRVFELDARAAKRFGEGTMVIPAPREVDALMKCVPRGRLVTSNELRAALAGKHRATMACPITTGIFAWIAAYAAAEAGEKRGGTPYWRTLKIGGEINPNYPGGAAAISRKLRAEGHRITRRGKRAFVADYKKALANVG